MTGLAPLDPITEALVGEVEKGTDLVIRVRALEVDDAGDKLSFVDVREYVPSSETYARGVLIPKVQAKAIAKLISEAVKL